MIISIELTIRYKIVVFNKDAQFWTLLKSFSEACLVKQLMLKAQVHHLLNIVEVTQL